MIKSVQGDLFDSCAEALVNAVNCVGVMGGGIAREFKHRFPKNYKSYRDACKNGRVIPGKMFATLHNDTFIINFPTKDHYCNPSYMSYIEDGLKDLIATIDVLNIKSVAIPALGCGLGGLLWSEVKPLIIGAFESIPHVTVYLYEPIHVDVHM